MIEHGANLDPLFKYYSWNESAFPREAYRMTYVANHDSNAWEGTAEDVFGEAVYAVFALSVVGEGMPLVYNGLDAEYNEALWHGVHGGRMIPIVNSAADRVLSFVRRKNADEVFGLFNLHDQPHSFELKDRLVHKTYTNHLTGEPVTFRQCETVTLQPWEFLIAVK